LIKGKLNEWRLRACDGHPLYDTDGTGFLNSCQ